MEKRLSPGARRLAQVLGIRPMRSVGLRAYSREASAIEKPPPSERPKLIFEASKVSWKRKGIFLRYSACYLEVNGLRVARVRLGKRGGLRKMLWLRFDHGGTAAKSTDSLHSKKKKET